MFLSTEVKSHVIITFTKIHYFITQSQFNIVSKMGGDEQLTIGDNVIKTNNIADILTLEKYYGTYPDKKPLAYQPLPNYKRVVYNKQQLIRALSEIIRGFKKHFGDRTLPPQSQTILAKMELHLEKARQAKDDKTFNLTLKPFYNQF